MDARITLSASSKRPCMASSCVSPSPLRARLMASPICCHVARADSKDVSAASKSPFSNASRERTYWSRAVVAGSSPVAPAQAANRCIQPVTASGSAAASVRARCSASSTAAFDNSPSALNLAKASGKDCPARSVSCEACTLSAIRRSPAPRSRRCPRLRTRSTVDRSRAGGCAGQIVHRCRIRSHAAMRHRRQATG